MNTTSEILGVGWGGELTEKCTCILAECIDDGIKYNGHDINNGYELITSTATDCQKQCKSTCSCNFFTWSAKQHRMFFWAVFQNYINV